MIGPDLSSATWRKSSHSGSGANCVEVAFLDGCVAVRNTNDRDGSLLAFTPAEWEAFIAGARDGEFDLPT